MCLLYTLEVPQAWQAFQRNTAFCFAPLATLVIKGTNSQRIQYDQYVRRRCFWTDVDDLSGQICPCLSLFYCRFWWFCDQPADPVSGFLQAAAVYGQKLPNHLISSLQSVYARWIKQWSHSTLLWFSLSLSSMPTITHRVISRHHKWTEGNSFPYCCFIPHS